MEEDFQEKEPVNEMSFSQVVRVVLIIFVIISTSAILINQLSKNADKNVSSKNNGVVLVDPNNLSDETREKGFTTERINNHFLEFIDLYFPEEKDKFKGWQVQYKKNEEWNKITWTSVDGEENDGHYEGMCDFSKKIIYLNDDYFPRYDSHDDVLIHEMIHVVCPEAGHQGKFMDECTRIAKLCRFTRARIYGYNGWGTVD